MSIASSPDAQVTSRRNGVEVIETSCTGDSCARSKRTFRIFWCFGAHSDFTFSPQHDVIDLSHFPPECVRMVQTEVGIRIDVTRNQQSILLRGFRWHPSHLHAIRWPALFEFGMMPVVENASGSDAFYFDLPHFSGIQIHGTHMPSSVLSNVFNSALSEHLRPGNENDQAPGPSSSEDPSNTVYSFEWNANQHSIVEFDPQTDQINFSELQWGQFTIEEDNRGVIFRMPANNQSVALKHLFLAELSEENFIFGSPETRRLAFPALHALGLGILR